MENTIKRQKVLVQLQLACMEVAHGCELAALGQVNLEDVDLLLMALLEMAGQAEKLRESIKNDAIGVECEEDAASCDCLWHENLARAEASHIDPELDHDGDTQPSNERPEPSEK